MTVFDDGRRWAVVGGVPRVVLQLEGNEGVEIHTINQRRDAWEGGPLRNAVAAVFLHDSGEVASLHRPCSDKRTRWGGGCCAWPSQGKSGAGRKLQHGGDWRLLKVLAVAWSGGGDPVRGGHAAGGWRRGTRCSGGWLRVGSSGLQPAGSAQLRETRLCRVSNRFKPSKSIQTRSNLF
jgi:hypothetical protein